MTADPTPAAERYRKWRDDEHEYATPEDLWDDEKTLAIAYLAREAAVARLVVVAKEVARVLELQPPSKLGGLDCSRLASWLRAAVTTVEEPPACP